MPATSRSVCCITVSNICCCCWLCFFFIFEGEKTYFRTKANNTQDTVGFPHGLFFFFMENFPIDGPLWEVRQMLLLLMFGADTRVCLQQNKTFASSCAFMVVCLYVCDNCKNVSICTKT